jgi:hypothetical protein
LQLVTADCDVITHITKIFVSSHEPHYDMLSKSHRSIARETYQPSPILLPPSECDQIPLFLLATVPTPFPAEI